MDIPHFSFDYTFLDIPGLASQCITTDEIEFVFYGPASFYADWHRTDNIGYMIGYSLKNKFISFTFELVGDGSTVRLVDVFLSNEFEIRNRYYGYGPKPRPTVAKWHNPPSNSGETDERHNTRFAGR